MTQLTCSQGVELLMEYFEGTLSADLRAAIEAHVARCPRCVAFVESYRRTPDVLREATARALPEDLQQSLIACLRAQRGRARDGD